MNAQSFPTKLRFNNLHKAEMVSVPVGTSEPEESPAPGKYDNSIYSVQYTTNPAVKETYVINSNFGAIPEGEIAKENSAIFLPGVFMKNLGSEVLTGAKLQCVISHFPLSGGAATKVYDKLSDDRLNIEPDSVMGITNEAFDFKNGKGIGRYQYVYTVSQDSTDASRTDNALTSNTYVTKNLYSKGRINPTNKQLQVTQYWGGGTDYREVLFPLSFSNGEGYTADTLFAAIASNDGVADIYVEAKLYEWTDLDSDQTIDNDEMLLAALGTYTVPSGVTGNFINLRIGFENIATNDPKYKIKSGVLYFASLAYPGGGKSFFSGYDMVPSHRMLVNLKDAAETLQYEDYPYLSVRTQDGATGGPDMSTASLFYVDLDMSSAASDNEIFFFPASLAMELGGSANAAKDITKTPNMDVKVNPNPAKEFANLSVQLRTPSPLKVEIVSGNGAIIETENIKTNQSIYNKSINVTSLPAGTYIVKVTTNEGSVKRAFNVIK